MRTLEVADREAGARFGPGDEVPLGILCDWVGES